MQEDSRQHAKDAPDSQFRWLEIDGSDLRFLIRKHLALALFLVFLCAAIGFALTKVLRPVFTSQAVVYLRPNFEKDIELQNSFSKLDDDDSLRSVEMAMVSDTVILNTIERLGLRDEEEYLGPTYIGLPPRTDYAVLKRIRKRYKSKLIPNTRLVELKGKDYSAERSKLIVETMIEEFLAHLKAERDRKQKVLRATLVEQADAALAEALESEKKLEAFRAENPEMIVEQDSEVFQERLLQYGEALNDAIAEKSDLEGTLLSLKNIDPKEEPYRIFQILQNRNSEYLSDLMRMHAEAKSKLASVAERNTADHPSYREAAGELKEVEATIAKYATEMKSGLDSEFQAASSKVEKFSEDLAKVQKEFVSFKSKSAEFRGIKETIDRSWNTYSSLQEKVTDLDLYPETELNFVTVISRPIVPDKKSAPKGSLWAAGGGVLGMILVAGILGWRYRNGLPITDETQVNSLPGVESIGCLEVPRKAKVGEPVGREWLNPAIAVCRSRILHVSAVGPGMSVTRVPSAIAQTYATKNIRTLVISIRETAEEPIPELKPDDTQMLTTLDWSIERLLEPEQLVRKMARCLESFDRIILDTTAVKSRAARDAVASIVEANVIAIVEEVSTRQELKVVVDQLRGAGAEKVSALLLRERRRIKKTELLESGTESIPEFSKIRELSGRAAVM